MVSEHKFSNIQLVPHFMKEDNKEFSDDYEPKVVSLGPYHHGKEKLKFVEDFKPKAVEMFIGDSGVGEDDLMAAILGEIGYAKSCYLEEFTSKYSDEVFARMMLQDACVILNYIGPWQEEKHHKKFQTTYYLADVVYANIGRDMYLVENQVPFQILKMLISLRYGTHDGDRFAEYVESSFFIIFFPDAKVSEKPKYEDDLGMNPEPRHLLELFRRIVVTGLDYECVINLPYRSLCLGNCRLKESIRTRWYVFCSVTDLKSKGIHLRASGIKSLKGVTFSPSTNMFQSAYLKLPSCHVTTYTRVLFMNMIAYEFSPFLIIHKDVTAYVSLMQHLMVSKEDVKELREKGIISTSSKSDDEQVVQLYKALNTYDILDDHSYLWGVKYDIEKHINSKAKTWMAEIKAQLTTNYFNSPWSIIVFAASIFIILLDITQTYYAVLPYADKP